MSIFRRPYVADRQGGRTGRNGAAKTGYRGRIMSLQIDERSDGEVTIVDLKGKILMDCGLLDKVDTLVTEGRTKVLLNVAEVNYVDSAGLGEVVRCLTTLVRNGGCLKLLSPSKRVRHLLSITQLIKMFEIFEKEEDAVRSF
jgi:anti-sigma B factor antagonist